MFLLIGELNRDITAAIYEYTGKNRLAQVRSLGTARSKKGALEKDGSERLVSLA
jgi:hypothetical protein